MIVAGISIEDKTSASRRIRYKAVLSHLPDGFIVKKYKPNMRCDVLYIQKLLRPWTLQAAKKANGHGVPVVFDLDDIRENWTDKPYDKMFKYCSAITTDTEARAQVLREHTALPVYVVPDSIDYGIQPEDAGGNTNSMRKACTFGRWQNVRAAKTHFERYGLEWNYICDREVAGGTCIKWDQRTFVSELQRFGLVILAHHKHWAQEQKSANRLLVCMALGIPVLAEANGEIAKVLAECGCDNLLLEKRTELKAIDRATVQANFFDYVWTRYHPCVSAKTLAKVFYDTAV